jgi:hypothetical protein
MTTTANAELASARLESAAAQTINYYEIVNGPMYHSIHLASSV